MEVRARQTLPRRAAAAVLACTPLAAEPPGGLLSDLDFPTIQTAGRAVQTALETLPSDQAQAWSVANVASGTVVPRRTWRSVTGHWCRSYDFSIRTAGGASERRQGIVRCRSDSGRWKAP